MSELTNVIQHPQEAADKIARLEARVAELEGALRKIQILCNFSGFDMLTVGLVCRIRDAFKEVLK